MGRPLKVGLDYFPVDLNIAEDGPVAFVEAKYGISAFGVLIKLLIKIYRQGYYIAWTEQDQYLFLKHTPNLDITALQNIVSAYINSGFFNKNIADQYQVLTSHGIQKRYITACSRRDSVTLCKPYSCIVPDHEEFPTDNVRLIPLNVDNKSISVNIVSTITPVNTADSTQSRVEESRVEESRVLSRPISEILQLWNVLVPDLPEL